MPKRFLQTTSRMRWAMAATAAAALFLVYQLWRGDTPVVPPAARAPVVEATATTAAEDGTATSDFELQPSADYVVIVERPLFNRTRRPASPDEQKPGTGTAEDEKAASQVALNGIVVAGTRRVALLRFDDDPKVMHVSEGQRAGGWQVEKIAADRVFLRRGQQASEIVLDYKRRGDNQKTGVPAPPSVSGETPGADPDHEEVQD
jgi:hypothetical protein